MIFGVGLSRTGTTTLGDACSLLGMKRLGWVSQRKGHTDSLGQPISSALLLRDWQAKNTAHLADVASRYDILEDLPWPLVYGEMAEAFPDARFVLTRRSSPDLWLASMAKHQSGRGGGQWDETMTQIYGSARASADTASYHATYESHNADVADYFAGTGRLLEVCWEEGDGWPELCQFLGLAIPDEPFPHSNTAGSRPTGTTIAPLAPRPAQVPPPLRGLISARGKSGKSTRPYD